MMRLAGGFEMATQITRIMNCSYCGNSNPVSAKYCGHCGQWANPVQKHTVNRIQRTSNERLPELGAIEVARDANKLAELYFRSKEGVEGGTAYWDWFGRHAATYEAHKKAQELYDQVVDAGIRAITARVEQQFELERRRTEEAFRREQRILDDEYAALLFRAIIKKSAFRYG
ncbi:MAG: zinc ribbon domain-containing protein [Caldilineaceae bacterium]